MLKHKVAVIYGAGGGIGGAIARAFAGEGARVFLTRRHLAPVEAVAKDIAAAGGAPGAAEGGGPPQPAVREQPQPRVSTTGRAHHAVHYGGLPPAQPRGR